MAPRKKKSGRPPKSKDKLKSVRTSIRMTNDLRDQIEVLAEKHERSAADMTRILLQEAIRSYGR